MKFLIFLSVIALTAADKSVKFSCPLDCECSFDETLQIVELHTPSFKVSCVGLNLNELPMEYDKGQELKLLNFSRNSLTALDDETFNTNSKFAELIWLDLQENEIGLITDYAFRNLDKLRMLILTGNQLEEIPNFAWTANLQYLRLNSNRITKIAARAFEPLEQLKVLQLEHNEITSIQNNAFAGLSSLQHLNLHDNKLVRMPVDLFKGMAQRSQIVIVDFTGNPWTCDCFLKWPRQLVVGIVPEDRRMPNCTFGNKILGWDRTEIEFLFDKLCCPQNCRCNINTVDCSGVELDHLVDDIDTETRQLSLANNRIQQIDSSWWAERNLDQLKELDLSNNQIAIIKTETFVGLKKLERLILSNNKLMTVEPGAFEELDELQELDLMNNQLEHLPRGFIYHLSNKIKNNDKSGLLLANNPWHCTCNLFETFKFLHSFPPTNGLWPICQQPQLLKDNDWTSKEVDAEMTKCSKYRCPVNCRCCFSNAIWIRFPNRVLSVNCSYGLIRKIEKLGDPIAYELNLKTNLLTSLDSTSFNPNMTELVELDVSYNYLRIIEENAFDSFSYSLKKLDLTNNELTEVPTAAIRKTTSLVELLLVWNRISTIPSRAFETLKKLEVIDLGYNKIMTIEPNAFTGLFQLKKLSLYDNKLVVIPENVFKKLFEQQTINSLILNSNPWRCGCYLKWASFIIKRNRREMRDHMPTCSIADCKIGSNRCVLSWDDEEAWKYNNNCSEK